MARPSLWRHFLKSMPQLDET